MSPTFPDCGLHDKFYYNTKPKTGLLISTIKKQYEAFLVNVFTLYRYIFDMARGRNISSLIKKIRHIHIEIFTARLQRSRLEP